MTDSHIAGHQSGANLLVLFTQSWGPLACFDFSVRGQCRIVSRKSSCSLKDSYLPINLFTPWYEAKRSRFYRTAANYQIHKHGMIPKTNLESVETSLDSIILSLRTFSGEEGTRPQGKLGRVRGVNEIRLKTNNFASIYDAVNNFSANAVISINLHRSFADPRLSAPLPLFPHSMGRSRPRTPNSWMTCGLRGRAKWIIHSNKMHCQPPPKSRGKHSKVQLLGLSFLPKHSTLPPGLL